MALPREDREYKVSGRVYNKQSSEFIEGVNVSLAGESVKTDTQGRFTITVMLPTDPEDDTVNGPRFITYTKGALAPRIQNIITGGNRVKTTLNNVSLFDLPLAVEQEIQKIKSEVIDVVEDLKGLLSKDPTQAALSLLARSIQRLSDSLIPLLLRLLINFGISSFDQMENRSCPDSNGMMEVVRRKNRITRELNNIFRRIATVTALQALFVTLRAALTNARISLLGLPAPAAFTPVGAITTLSDIVDRIKDREREFDGINRSLLIGLLMMTLMLSRIVRMNNQLDELINECSGDEDFTIEALSEELIALATEEVEDGNPRTTNVNGFNLDVQVDDMAVGSLNRRFAIARDSNGVIVLRGEKSLSASDQILIDELAYYIQVNNLKA